MEVSRRDVLTGATLVAGIAASQPVDACSLLAHQRPVNFSDAACRRSLAALVELINSSSRLSDAALSMRASELGIRFDESVVNPLMNHPNLHPVEDADLIRAWTRSNDRRDRSPMVLQEINLLKSRKGVAIYQFTTRRDVYHAELMDDQVDGGGCDISHPSYYEFRDSSYIGLFRNNKLSEVSTFDVWLTTP